MSYTRGQYVIGNTEVTRNGAAILEFKLSLTYSSRRYRKQKCPIVCVSDIDI